MVFEESIGAVFGAVFGVVFGVVFMVGGCVGWTRSGMMGGHGR